MLAAELRVAAGAGGYGSGEAAKVVRALRKIGVYGRPLGNVVYLMVTPTTEPEQCRRLLKKLLAVL